MPTVPLSVSKVVLKNGMGGQNGEGTGIDM